MLLHCVLDSIKTMPSLLFTVGISELLRTNWGHCVGDPSKLLRIAIADTAEYTMVLLLSR